MAFVLSFKKPDLIIDKDYLYISRKQEKSSNKK